MKNINGNNALKMDAVAIVQIANMETRKEIRNANAKEMAKEMVTLAFEFITTAMVVGSIFAMPILAMLIK